MRRDVAVVLVVILLAFVPIAASLPITDLDEDTPLTERSAWDTFQDKGHVTVKVTAPRLQITVSETDDGVELSGWNNNFANDYIRVKYREDIPRKIRFFIPSNFVGPYYDETVVSQSGDDVPAKLVPVEGGRYLAVVITFDGPTDATYKIDKVRGRTWEFWADKDERLEDRANVSVGLAGSETWNYADSTKWSPDGILTIEVDDPSRLMVQYDAEISNNSEVWINVPDEETSRDPVYHFVREREDGQSTVVVIDRDGEDPPAIRYKLRPTSRDGLGAIFDDWRAIPDRVDKILSSIFG